MIELLYVLERRKYLRRTIILLRRKQVLAVEQIYPTYII